MLISDVQAHHRPDMGIIYVTGAILLLAVATLVVRYASAKYPSGPGAERGR
jgi:phosphate starvation-inducible membrane PsiE